MLGRGLTATVALVLLLAAPAAALDTWGVREQLPVPASIDHVNGLAASPDGETLFLAEQEQQNPNFDCFGNPYSDVLVHRMAPDGSVTTVDLGPGATTNGNDVPLAVTGDGKRLLVAIDGNVDADGDCVQPTPPAAMVELDAATLDVERELTRDDFGGLPVRGVAATASATYVLAYTEFFDAAPVPVRLSRYDGTPASGSATWTTDLGGGRVINPEACAADRAVLAADPNGDPLVSFPSSCPIAAPEAAATGGLVRLSGTDGRPVALVAAYSTFGSGARIGVDGDGTILTDLRQPSIEPDGSTREARRFGVSALRRDGSLLRAWGDVDSTVTFEPCRFRNPPFVAAVGEDVVTMTPDRRLDSPGPQLTRWGSGGRTEDCLVRPGPAASVTPDPGVGEVGEPVTLALNAQPARLADYDADNAIASVAWRIGDGPFEPAGAETTRTATFDAPGSFAVDVRVTDSYGAVTERRRDFVVRAPAPRPSLSVSASTAAVNTDVTLDASATSGSVVRYELDLDGDGSFETDNGPRATRTHRFLVPGSLSIGLRVTDSSGNQAQTTTPVTVTSAAPPPLALAGTSELPPTAAAEPSTPQPAAPPRPSISTPSRVDGRGRLTVRVACPLAAADACRLRTTLRRRGRGGSSLAPSVTMRIGPGASRRVALRVTDAGRRSLRRSRSLRATVAVRWNSRTVSRDVTLRPRKSKR